MDLCKTSCSVIEHIRVPVCLIRGLRLFAGPRRPPLILCMEDLAAPSPLMHSAPVSLVADAAHFCRPTDFVVITCKSFALTKFFL